MRAVFDATGTRRGRAVQLLIDRPAALLALGCIVAVCGFSFWVDPGNPPGFIRDEASISYNAYTISQTLHDQDGALTPLYFTSFGDYKSPLFVYVLAAVFRVTEPHAEVARATAAGCVLVAVLLLGLLAYRRTRSLGVATAVVVLGGLMPWLFQLGRVAYETCSEPLLLALGLVAVDWACRSRSFRPWTGIPVGLAIGGLAYTYAGARLLAPLLALSLIVFAGRGRWRWLLTAWATFAATLIPVLVYAQRHPGALTARYRSTTFIQDGMSVATIVRDAASNYAHDVNLWHWVSSGDPKPYINVWGTGELFGAVVALAAIGLVVVLGERRGELWWRFVFLALVLSPIPAALTADRYYSLRLVPVPVLLLVLAIPGLEWLVCSARAGWPGRAAAVVLAAGVAVQFGIFLHWYGIRGPARTELFEAGVPALLQQAFAGGATVYIDHDDRYAQTHALWYAVSHGLPRARVSILPDGGMPPPGSMVFGRLQACDYVCTQLGAAQTYWIAKAVGPKPS